MKHHPSPTLSLLLTLTILLTAICILPASPLTASTPRLPGDVNGDGKVDIEDIFAVRDHIFGTAPLSDEDFDVADVNGDSAVDIADILEICSMIFGKKPVGHQTPVPPPPDDDQEETVPVTTPAPTDDPTPTPEPTTPAPRPTYDPDDPRYMYQFYTNEGPHFGSKRWLSTVYEVYLKVGETKVVRVVRVKLRVLPEEFVSFAYTVDNASIANAKKHEGELWDFEVAGKKAGTTTVLVQGYYEPVDGITPSIGGGDNWGTKDKNDAGIIIHETVTIHVTE